MRLRQSHVLWRLMGDALFSVSMIYYASNFKESNMIECVPTRIWMEFVRARIFADMNDLYLLSNIKFWIPLLGCILYGDCVAL